MIVLLLILLLQTPSERNAATVREFQHLTGYPNGRKGFVVDHIIPLCAGGADAVSNMQWQLKATSYQKDIFERALCKAMKKQGMQLQRLKP